MFNELQELDVKAGGGQNMSIGQMLRQWLVKLEWFSTLFPRIPVPIQQKIQKYLEVKVGCSHCLFNLFNINIFLYNRQNFLHKQFKPLNKELGKNEDLNENGRLARISEGTFFETTETAETIAETTGRGRLKKVTKCSNH